MRPIPLLATSLILNGLLLGAVVWKGRLDRPASVPNATVEPDSVHGLSEDAEGSAPEPRESPAREFFHWSQLDTANWFAYRDGLGRVFKLMFIE